MNYKPVSHSHFSLEHLAAAQILPHYPIDRLNIHSPIKARGERLLSIKGVTGGGHYLLPCEASLTAPGNPGLPPRWRTPAAAPHHVEDGHDQDERGGRHGERDAGPGLVGDDAGRAQQPRPRGRRAFAAVLWATGMCARVNIYIYKCVNLCLCMCVHKLTQVHTCTLLFTLTHCSHTNHL